LRGECAEEFAVRGKENESKREGEKEKKKGTVRIGCPTQARANLALLLGGGGFGGGVGVLLGETLDAASGVNQLLLAGEEGMAVRADFHAQHVALDG